MDRSGRGDMEKRRYWQQTIREATRSGLSTREFCRRHRIKESRFYWWQRKLRTQTDARSRPPKHGGRMKEATFALVSDAPGALEAGIELVLSDGRRVRIGKGVDPETLQTVLVTLGSGAC
jgi:hypothetical protein